jgi:hypothetical protein
MRVKHKVTQDTKKTKDKRPSHFAGWLDDYQNALLDRFKIVSSFVILGALHALVFSDSF